MKITLTLCVTLLLIAANPSFARSEAEQETLKHAHWVALGDPAQKRRALKLIQRRGDQSMVAPLVHALRFAGGNVRPDVVKVLEKLTRKSYGDDWFRWMEWIQDHPEVETIEGFEVYLSNLFSSLDPDFRAYIYPGVRHNIPLQEVMWGGVAATDGIPPLDHPRMVAADNAEYLSDNERVFGVALNGDVRAYPYRFMDWHEMLNDTIGGQAVSLAYCTLCGAGILYAAEIDGSPVKFGSSGLLYRSNKLMFDHRTNTLWNQFTGQPAIGTLADKPMKLSVLPLVTTTWGDWLATHPNTRVMHPDTGFERDYSPGKAYGKYFRSRALMFPSPDDERAIAQKALVFGLRISGAAKAWALTAFRKSSVINDQLGTLGVVLIGSERERNVRAYRRGQMRFSESRETGWLIAADGARWKITEDSLRSPNGDQLTRLPGHLGYWFAWHNYFGAETLAR